MDSVDAAKRAVKRGAHRLELCTNLHLDGTTPVTSDIRAVQRAVRIPVKVMIRPRAGDFVFSDVDFARMFASIQMCKSLGIPEIATGILHQDNTLDMRRLSLLADAAYPMRVTVHKCIDRTPDILSAIEQLKSIPNVTHVLSSGQADTAEQGAGMLKKMLGVCGTRLTLIVAGKVTQENLATLMDKIGASEYHGRNIVSK